MPLRGPFLLFYLIFNTHRGHLTSIGIMSVIRHFELLPFCLPPNQILLTHIGVILIDIHNERMSAVYTVGMPGRYHIRGGEVWGVNRSGAVRELPIALKSLLFQL